MKAIFLPAARADPQNVRRYVIARFGGETWRDTFARIQRDVAHIETFPKSGQIPAELMEIGHPHYRQVVSGMNRIIYEIDDPAIYIHLIVDTRRNLKDVLEKRLLQP